MNGKDPAETYDYVIAGAGSAGCVLANRLSADPKNRVLLLEGGGRDNWIWFHIPVGYLFAIGNPRADWMFKTAAETGLNGRALAYPRGKVLGGSSAINAMIYMRGQAADYDHWRQLGLRGWGWDDVLPVFKRVEDHVEGESAFHGAGGEWRVEHPRISWEILDRVRDAAEAAGVKKIADFNTGDNTGSAYFQVNQKSGRRWSAARGFLKPAMKRPNLRIETGVTVERVNLEDGRAVSVTYRRDGETMTAGVRGEVVLASGSVGSPLILERSGIGAAERLKAHGIEAVHHLPGVGENLQDHLQIRPIYRVHGIKTLNTEYWNLFSRALMGASYLFRRRGPLTMAPSQVGAFVKSSPEYETANLEFHFQPLSLDDWGHGLHRFSAFTASVCNLRPDEPRLDPHVRPEGRGRAGHPPELSLHRDRQARRGGFPEMGKAHRVADAARSLPAGGGEARRAHRLGRGDAGGGRRSRHDDLPPCRHRQDGNRGRPDGGGRRTAPGARHPGAEGDRRLGDADDHLRQHQFADHHDRRQGRGDDAGGCQSMIRKRGNRFSAGIMRKQRDRARSRPSPISSRATFR